MVYGFLDNVCGDFLWYSVVWYSMQWYFVTCGPTDIGVVGFRPSGVRTAFEQQTGELSNALSLYFTDARCVCRHGFISCHAIWEDVWSHTIWEAFSIISSLSLILISLLRRCHMGWCGFKPFRSEVFLIISSSGLILTSFVQWTLSVSIHDTVTPLHREAYSIISSLSLIFTSFVSP